MVFELHLLLLFALRKCDELVKTNKEMKFRGGENPDKNAKKNKNKKKSLLDLC